LLAILAEFRFDPQLSGDVLEAGYQQGIGGEEQHVQHRASSRHIEAKTVKLAGLSPRVALLILRLRYIRPVTAEPPVRGGVQSGPAIGCVSWEQSSMEGVDDSDTHAFGRFSDDDVVWDRVVAGPLA
jgi:hypothetical protein